MKCDKKHMLLYAVTDRAWVGEKSLYEQVEAALKGGATCVQLREKELDEETFLSEAMEIAALCRKYQVPFFVNDNVEIAVKCRADGIHVGQEDMEAGKVRQRVGDRCVCPFRRRSFGSGEKRRRLSGSRGNVFHFYKNGCRCTAERNPS